MIEFMRSLFGLEGSSDSRTVVGDPVDIDPQDVPYIKDSHKRLSELQHLYSRYKGTPYEQKFKTIYDKTRRIHRYLVGRKRAHELELFHVQHTDHFITTYSVILDVHERHTDSAATVESAELEKEAVATADSIPGNVKPEKGRVNGRRQVRPVMDKDAFQRVPVATLTAGVPVVVLPDVSIDTFSRIPYKDEALASGEIGFTSAAEEKEAFLRIVSAHLGIEQADLSYVGNAPITFPSAKGMQQTYYAPVVYWKSMTYALDLEEYRLFPVRIYRRGL